MTEKGQSALSSAVSGAALLAAIALLCTLFLNFTESATRDRIATNERNFRLALLNELVPASAYDNDFPGDSITVRDPGLLGTPEAVQVYRASLQGKPVAAVIMPVAPQGYTGPIHLAVAVRADGTLAGVRATQHNETAGLGDAIDSDKSDWILGFAGRSLTNPEAAGWQLTRDGGQFDSFTGASVTPRAVVQAVRDALLYFEANRNHIFTSAPE